MPLFTVIVENLGSMFDERLFFPAKNFTGDVWRPVWNMLEPNLNKSVRKVIKMRYIVALCFDAACGLPIHETLKR
jgi:hypothetical protein